MRHVLFAFLDGIPSSWLDLSGPRRKQPLLLTQFPASFEFFVDEAS
jgi:hypothetical protein